MKLVVCVDVLAHIKCDLNFIMIFYESCPIQIKCLFEVDAATTN
jgi:hypothetical protein